MEYIIKEIIDGQEEIIYTKYYDELEIEYFDQYLEEHAIDEEGGDMNELWNAFFESKLYEEFLEFIGEGGEG